MVRGRSSLRHRVAAATAITSVAVVLAGCSASNPLTTTKAYSASDGIRAELGDLTAENLLVLAAATGEPAALQGAFTNRGTESVTVEVASIGGSSVGSVDVAPGSTVLLGDAGESLEFVASDPPGAVTSLTIETAQGGTLTIAVPVLDDTLPQYASSMPTPTPTRD